MEEQERLNILAKYAAMAAAEIEGEEKDGEQRKLLEAYNVEVQEKQIRNGSPEMRQLHAKYRKLGLDFGRIVF